MRTARSARVAALICAATVLAAGHGPPDSPVADAAMRGDVAAVRALLAEGADVNAPQGDGMTALHWAARRDEPELAEMLLNAGGSVASATRIGRYTPLHLAAKRGSAPIVALLLDHGADATAATSNSGATPLHLAAASGSPEAVRLLVERGADPNAREAEWGQTPLTFAAAANRPRAIRALIEAGADPELASRVVDLREQGRIDGRARRRQSEVLKAFTDDGERPPTPAQLQAAVLASREKYEVAFVAPEPEGSADPETGAEDGDDEEDGEENPFLPSIRKTGGLTPLLHAVRQGHLEAALALLEGGAEIDRPSAADGTTPLLMATINGQFDLALELLERGADPNLASTLNGVTPLWAAVNAKWQPRTRFPQPQERGLQRAGYLDVMEALLAAGADPNARITRHPWYMVYTGCGNRNCGLVDTNGSTAFWRAAYATDVDAMRLLVAHGADPHIPTKAPPRRQRMSPDEFLRQQARNQLRDSSFVELADSARHELLFDIRGELSDSARARFPDEVLFDLTDSVRVELLEAAEVQDSLRALEPDASGLPPVEPGGPGVWPIHAASGVGYGEGFAGNAHRHAPDGWVPAVRYLVEELGADVNARDHNGYNAIHHAAARGDDELILYLVEQGGDVTAVSRRGQTTADMANGPVQRVSPFPETVALLESLGSENNHNCLSC